LGFFPTAFWQKAGEKKGIFPRLFSNRKKGFSNPPCPILAELDKGRQRACKCGFC